MIHRMLAFICLCIFYSLFYAVEYPIAKRLNVSWLESNLFLIVYIWSWHAVYLQMITLIFKLRCSTSVNFFMLLMIIHLCYVGQIYVLNHRSISSKLFDSSFYYMFTSLSSIRCWYNTIMCAIIRLLVSILY